MKGAESIFSLATAMLGIAMVAVIVQSPNTAAVITASANGFSSATRAVMGQSNAKAFGR